MSNMSPPDRTMRPPPNPVVPVLCEGCGNTFPLRQSNALECPKCVLLAQHEINSDRYKDIQKWPQCCKCGSTRRNMASATVEMVAWAGELTCGSSACTKGTPAEAIAQDSRRVFGQRVEVESENPLPASQTQPLYPRRSGLVQSALNEASQARMIAVRERLVGKQSSAMRAGLSIADLRTVNTTQSLLYHEHGGGVPGEDKVWIGWQVRSNNTPKRIDPDLGGGFKKHAMSRFMPDIKAEILATINVDWIRSHYYSINPEETSFRWSGNRTLDPNTANLSAQEFYDYYNRPSEGNAAIRGVDVPAFFKSTVKGQKGPKLFLEIYIDHAAWLRRTQSLSDEDNVSSMVVAQRKKRGRNDSTASITSAKAKQPRASGGGVILQSEFNTTANRTRRLGTTPEIRTGCNEVTLEKHVCVADVVGGASSIMGTGNTLTGSLASRPFGRGSMKLAYDLYIDGGEHLVAKRFFRLDSNSPANDESQVPNEHDHQEAIENEGLRLAEGAWFLREFYKYCSLPEYSDIAIEKNIQFATAFVGKEVSHPRSHASGKATDMGQPLVWWLIEPKRPSTVIKFSGTLKHPVSRQDILGLTIYAIAHFVYLLSKGTRVMADIQGTASHINGKDVMVLFDIMTHSTTGDTGIGDFGDEGIRSFLRDHTCGKVCRGLGLHEKQIAGHNGDEQSSDENEEIEQDEEKQDYDQDIGAEVEEGEVEE